MSRPGISIDPPGRAALFLRHLVLDYNGTLACRGRLVPGVAERLRELAALLAVHVVTLDTFGSARAELDGELAGGGLTLDIVARGGPEGSGEAEGKLRLVRNLGPDRCCAVGNGANDGPMLAAAALSVCVMGREGCAVDTLNRAMICVADVRDALDLLLHPASCAATLRR